MIKRLMRAFTYRYVLFPAAFFLVSALVLIPDVEVRAAGGGVLPGPTSYVVAAARPSESPGESPIVEPVIESTDIVEEGSAGDETWAEPSSKPALEKPADKAAEKPVVKPAVKPVKKAAEKPAEKPVVKPVKKAAEKPAVKPVEKAAEKPAVKPVKKAAEKPAVKPVKKAVEKAAPKPSVKPLKKPSKKASKKPEAKPSEKASAQASSSQDKPAKEDKAANDDGALENSMQQAQKKGPVEVRVKRLYGFDAKLSGTTFGWVDQIDIDDKNDEVYLLDKDHKRIVVTNVAGSYLFHFDYTLAGIKNPLAFTVDSLSGEIYIIEQDRIAVLNYRGEFQGDFNLSQVPGDKKMYIQSLQLVKGEQGDLLYIGDSKNRRVIVFTTEGKYVRSYGNSRWVGNNIKGLYVGKERIFWLDSTGFSVKSIGLDGKDKRSFGRISSLTGGFSMPSGLTVDEIRKRILVVDANRMMVIVFDFNGNTLFEFGGPRLFSWPRAVAVDKLGHIFVADNRGIIRVFQAVPLTAE